MKVYFNQGEAIHRGSGHKLITLDLCLTGPQRIPVAYHNVARSADCDKTAKGVFVNGHPVCHQHSVFAKSRGDEAGTHKGIRSRTLQGPAEFISGSKTVFIEGVPGVSTGALMVSNQRNTLPSPVFV